MAFLHVLLSFLDFQVLSLLLYLVSLRVLLLLGQRALDLLEVKQFGAKLESQRKFLLQFCSVTLDLLSVSIFELTEGLGILLLGLKEIVVPLLVEFLVLLDVGLLTLLALLRLVEDELLLTTLVVLQLEFSDPVFGHLGFDVLALDLTGVAVLFENLAVE